MSPYINGSWMESVLNIRFQHFGYICTVYGLKEDWTIISEDCTSLYAFSIVSGFSKVVQTWKSLFLKGWCSCNYIHRTFPIHTVYKQISRSFFLFFQRDLVPYGQKRLGQEAADFTGGRTSKINSLQYTLSQTHACPVVQKSRVPFGTYFYLHFPMIAWRNWDIPQTCSSRVATGPYTNLAAALHRDGTVTRTKIRRVYAEGGRLHVPEGQVCMLHFFLILAVKNGDSFSGNDWSQTQFPIFCTCCLFQFQIYTGMFHNALALFPCGFSSGSQPHTVKIMSWRSSFQWSVKDIKGHLKQ